MVKYRVFERELKKLIEKSLLRSVRDRAGPQGARIVLGGKEFLNFASNDYLGLCGSAELAGAAAEALRAFGAGSGASRLLAGGSTIHAALEQRTATLKGAPAALLLNSGYSANTGLLPVLASEGDELFSDELNHASLIDGARLSRAKTTVYRHADAGHLQELLGRSRARRKLVVTDSVFSMEGDVAPLARIAALCDSHGAMLYLDDAHGTGVLGGGKGALAHFGLSPGENVLQMGTYSKALGSFGAFAAGAGSCIGWLINSTRSFMYSTALPAHVAAASLAAVELVLGGTPLVERLWENRRRLFEGLRALGLDTGASESPIIPVMLKDVAEALALAGHLEALGIYAPAIRPPTVKRPRLRLSVTAAHTEKDIGMLLEALGSF